MNPTSEVEAVAMEPALIWAIVAVIQIVAGLFVSFSPVRHEGAVKGLGLGMLNSGLLLMAHWRFALIKWIGDFWFVIWLLFFITQGICVWMLISLIKQGKVSPMYLVIGLVTFGLNVAAMVIFLLPP